MTLVRSRRAHLSAAALVATALVALAAVATPLGAHAADTQDAEGSTVTWGVRPAASEAHGAERANYYYEVEPGDVIDDALVVNNYSDVEIDLLVYAADAFTTADGALDLVTRAETSTGVGAWAVTPHPQVTVPAAGSVEVPFTVTVPANATPGDHAGGIVTSLVNAESAEGITVDRRLGSRIHVRVGGELAPAIDIERLGVDYRGTLSPFGAGAADVGFALVNTGNVRLSGEQTVVVSGPFGIGSWSETVAVPELLPGDRRAFEVRLDGVLPLLWLGAEVSLAPLVEGGETDVAVDTVVATASGAAIPWSLLVLLALAALLAVLLVLWRRSRKAAEGRRIEAAVAAALESAAPVRPAPVE